MASLRALAFRASISASLARADLVLERRRALSRLLHFLDAAAAGDEQEDVLEEDPGRVLQPAPLTRHHHAIHRLRPEHAAQHVIQRDDDRGRNQDPPVPVERQERERTKYVEVRFDAAAGEVDQERTHQHLRDGDDVPRRRQAGSKQAQERRETD